MKHCNYDFGHIFQNPGLGYDALHNNCFRGRIMQGVRRKASAASKQQAPRAEYIAAVRYPDGRRDLFHIRNADSLADARTLVISEVGDVRAVMIAVRRQ